LNFGQKGKIETAKKRREKDVRSLASSPALGSPRKDIDRDKRQDYLNEKANGLKQKKTVFRNANAVWHDYDKLPETAMHCIVISIIILNPKKVLCVFFHFSDFLRHFMCLPDFKNNFLFVQ